MRGILVPFDGSKNAMRALAYAIAHAKQTQSLVHILNVRPRMADYGRVAAYLSKQQFQKMAIELGEATLAPAVRRLRRARVPHVVHVIAGGIPETITRTARRLKCDSIIMGTRGMTALANLIVGSVANRVIHIATTPVTLVK